MKKKVFLVPLLMAGLLASCGSKVSELYPDGAYVGDLLDDFLTGYHQITNVNFRNPVIFNSDSIAFFDGFHENDFYDSTKSGSSEPSKLHAGPKTLAPSIFEYNNGTNVVTLDATPEKDWSQDLEGQNDSAYVGTSFGRTKCLVKCDPVFNNGILSKLYNGQIYCLGLHDSALVQLKEEGMDAALPKTMTSGDYFLMSLRGGSIFGQPRITSIDLTLRFYIGSDAYVLQFPSLPEWTDNGGDGVSFFGFKFSDVGIDPTGIRGYGISYSNLVDSDLAAGTLTDSQKENINSYWGLLIYEVMFLNSTWA